MNQILFSNFNLFNKRDKYLLLLKLQLLISILIIGIVFFVYYFSNNILKSKNLSKSLVSHYDISLLYNTPNNNIIENPILKLDNGETFSVIGMIEIKKINIKYPILSNTSDSLLKIAPCKFYGANPNEIGNLCIAAHNYDNSMFFSNLDSLINGDTIIIYDLNRKFVLLLCL